MLIAVNHHYVRESFQAPYPAIFGLTPEQFRQHLACLSKAGEFVSGDQVRDAVMGQAPLPKNSILITFDDGLREQFEVAWPILKEMGFPALFFINTEPIAFSTVSTVHKIHLLRSQIAPAEFRSEILRSSIVRDGNGLDAQITPAQYEHYRYDTPEVAKLKYLLNFVLDVDTLKPVIDEVFRDCFGESEEERMSKALYMDVDQIRELAEQGAIGSHSHQHLPLGLLSPEEIRLQLGLSIEWIEGWTGRKPAALSYPYGSPEACGGEVSRVAADCGFAYAFSMERAGNAALDRPLKLARFDNNDMPGGKASKWAIESLFDTVPERQW